jgi:hypothetical protein
MAYLYIVRCAFTRADLEQSWNDWYSGPKVRQMLAKPMFRAVQRFRLSSGSGRKYLALWQVASPEAFNTFEYTSDWGFVEWQPYIVDWSRDLFDATGTQVAAFAIPAHGFLQVISFDGMDAGHVDATRTLLATHADTMWFNSAGLDRHTPMIGLRRFPATTREQSSLDRSLPSGVQAGVYRPISEFRTAEAPAHFPSAP